MNLLNKSPKAKELSQSARHSFIDLKPKLLKIKADNMRRRGDR